MAKLPTNTFLSSAIKWNNSGVYQRTNFLSFHDLPVGWAAHDWNTLPYLIQDKWMEQERTHE